MIAVLLAVCLFMLASSSIPTLEPYSIGLRVVGALVVMAPVVWRRRLSERAPFPRFSSAVIATGLGFTLYLVASELAHGRAVAFVLGLISFLLVAFLTHALLHYYSTPQIVGGAYAAFLLICVASLVAQQLMPAIAIEHLRLRGVLENANGLGFVAFALGAVSLAARLVPWQSVLGLGVALTCLFLTASRASMLALIIVAIGLAIGGIRRARLVVVFGAISVSFVWLWSPGVLADVPLLRTTDTRSGGFEILRHAMSESFWTGLGDLPTETKVAGSPFAAGITGGMLGLSGLGTMYLALLQGLASSRPRALIFVVAGIIHSMFESWILSFSAPMLLTFFVALVGFVKLDTADEEQQTGRIPVRAQSLQSGGPTRVAGNGPKERRRISRQHK